MTSDFTTAKPIASILNAPRPMRETDSRLERRVREAVRSHPKYNGWEDWTDFWADFVLALPADLAQQVAANPYRLIPHVCDHDLRSPRYAGEPGGKARKEVEYLLWRRLRQLRQMTRKHRQ
jgi:hypothetical protein